MRFILLAGQQEPTSDNLSEFGQKSGGCRVFRGVRDIEPVSWSRELLSNLVFGQLNQAAA